MPERPIPSRSAAKFSSSCVGSCGIFFSIRIRRSGDFMFDRRKTVRVAVLVAVLTGAVGIFVAYGLPHYYKTQPIYIRGAVIKQNDDPMKESPITDVEVSVANNQAASSTKSNFAGFFSLRMVRGVSRNQFITIRFRHLDYQPLDLTELVGNRLSVVHLTPIHQEADEKPDRPPTPIANVLIRYSTLAAAQENFGTEAKTFQIPNVGNVPCRKTPPCSPDNQWKAAVSSQSMDAGEGSEYRNARVSCIAGPCPFTRIDSDGFSQGGRHILLQAEVFHPQINSIVRTAYPVILGTSLNFTLPPSAEGPSIEAEVNGENVIFPLGPNPVLSWAECNVIIDRNRAKFYRCDLKSDYKFQESK